MFINHARTRQYRSFFQGGEIHLRGGEIHFTAGGEIH
jgi:hypothetical protein